MVLYNPNIDLILWEIVNEDTLTSTGANWKMAIPPLKTLTESSLDEVANLAQPPDDMQKINRLRLDRAWMDLVNNDESVYVEFEDWINKSLSRFEMRIGCDSRDDVSEQKWPMVYGPGISPEEALSYIIPWADYEVDEDAHREGLEGVWSAECYVCYDKEDGNTYYSQSFDEWYQQRQPDGIVPCSEDGEVASYRLFLSLNDIGTSFLTMDEFLKDEPILLVGATE